MSQTSPILANERTAARLLDMKPTEFRALVDAGHLPGPREIAPGVERWDVSDLRRIGAGEVVEGLGDVAW
jgi:hypothetical protein